MSEPISGHSAACCMSCSPGNERFRARSSSDTIAAVLKCEPDWKALPGATPASIRELLRRCLDEGPGQSSAAHLGRPENARARAAPGRVAWQVAAIAAAALAALAIGASICLARLELVAATFPVDPDHQTTRLGQPARTISGWEQGHVCSRPGDVLRPRSGIRQDLARWGAYTTDARQLDENESGVFAGRRADRLHNR